jgi:hypothetical protein
MSYQSQVWSNPNSKIILITDLIDIIPLDLLEVDPDKSPALAYPPDSHLGRFPTWQAGLAAAREQAAKTGFTIVEERVAMVWETDIPAWVSEGAA